MSQRGLESFYSKLPVCLQNIACSIEGWRIKRKRFTHDFYENLEFLAKSYQWDQQKLQAYQEQQLSELLRFAYEHVPYYHQLFDSLGFSYNAIKSLQDIKKLPFLDKETVRLQKKSLLAVTHPAGAPIKGHTSGTTGTALSFYYSPETIAFEYACVWRLYQRAGIRISDPYATFNGQMIVPPQQKAPPFWRYNKACKQTLFSQHHTNKDNLKSYIQQLEKLDCTYWQGYSSFINLIANEILELKGGNLGNGPNVVFTSSETLFPLAKKIIKKATGAKVYNRYGLAEFCASMGECEVGNLHVDMEAGIVEVEPHFEDKTSITGELICTGLHNYTMPLIRYRTGDVGTMLKGTCPCGHQGKVFTHIDGRVEDYITTPQGVKLGRMDHIFKDALNVIESQILQDDIGKLTVKIVRRKDYSKKDEAILLKEFEQRVGSNMNICFEYVNEIPRLPNGKFRAVISKLK